MHQCCSPAPANKKSAAPSRAGLLATSKPLRIIFNQPIQRRSPNLLQFYMAPRSVEEDRAATESSRPDHAAGFLHTPRRGRRVAGVQMGWQSSLGHPAHATDLSNDKIILEQPAVVPRSSRSRPWGAHSSRSDGAVLTSFTPKKRRGPSTEYLPSESLSLPLKSAHRKTMPRPSRGPYLIDDEGFASATLLSKPGSPGKNHSQSESLLSPSPSFVAPPSAPARYDRLAAFSYHNHRKHRDVSSSNELVQGSRTTALSRCPLVAVEVRGMGRVAVGRDVAVQIGSVSERVLKASIAQAKSPKHAYAKSSSDESRHALGTETSESGHCSIFSVAASLPTTSQASAGLGPSTSFSLVSHFPESEEGSSSLERLRSGPSLQQSHRGHQLDDHVLRKVGFFKAKLLTSTSNANRSSTGQIAAISSAVADRSFTRTLPHLDWPDSPTGPWAAASVQGKSQDEERLDLIAHWLDIDDVDVSDPSVAPKIALPRPLKHSMVAKILRNRQCKRAEFAAQREFSKTTKDSNRCHLRPRAEQSGHLDRRGRRPRQSDRGNFAPVKESRRQERRRGSETLTPVYLFNELPDSDELSEESHVLHYCGSSNEDVPMAQGDACQRWHNMLCVRIDHVDELKERWFCTGCEARSVASPRVGTESVDGTPSIQAGSPATTVALGPPVKRGGTQSSYTPGFSDTVPAFPRTYAAHVGLGSPSIRLSTRLRTDESSHLPVFTHTSSDSPSAIVGGRSAAGLPMSSALALAPSPQMDVTEGMLSSNDRERAVQGRARASRIGWRATEPSSPLDKKSGATGTASSYTTPNTQRYMASPFGSRHQLSHSRSGGQPEHQTPSDFGGILGTDSPVDFSPTIFTNASCSDWDLATLHARRGLQRGHFGGSRTGTFSPTWSTQHHYASSATSSCVGTRFRFFPVASGPGRSQASNGEDYDGRDADDVFSTPSRHLPGSSWWGPRHPAATTPGKEVNGVTTLGLQTPSRSARRRESPGWGLGLATPGSGRDLFFGGNGTDVSGGGYSAGMPSLVFSSGGLLGDEGDFPTEHWQSASPTRSAPSAHRRSQQMSSGVGLGPSLLGCQVSTSSIRSSSSSRHRDLDAEETDPPTSSSPYPRTPSMNSVHRSNHAFPGTSSTPSSPTPNCGQLGTPFVGKRAGAALAEAVKASEESMHRLPQYVSKGGVVPPAMTARLRQVCTNEGDVAQFSLGLDLDEILDYF